MDSDLLMELWKLAHRCAYRVLGDYHAAEDVAQDAMMAFKARPEGEVRNPHAWIARLAINGAISLSRKPRPQQLLEDPALQESEDTADLEKREQDQVRHAEISMVLTPALRGALPAILAKYDSGGESLDAKEKRKVRRNVQLIKAAVSNLPTRRRVLKYASFTLLLGLGEFPLAKAQGESPATLDEIKAALREVDILRYRHGDLAASRRMLDSLIEYQSSFVQRHVHVESAHAETLIRLLDYRAAIALDQYDIGALNSTILPKLEQWLGLLSSEQERLWAPRVLQTKARLFFHQEIFPTAIDFARRLTGEVTAASFFKLTRGQPVAGYDGVMQGFEVGSFLSGIRGNEECYCWWEEAQRHLSAKGDRVGEARVAGRILTKLAQDHRDDVGYAKASANRLLSIYREVPELQTHQMLRIQHHLSLLPCLLIARKDSEAEVVFENLSDEICRSGYVQGAVRLTRACRFASGSLGTEITSRAQDVLAAARGRR